jgi:thiamine pyrophosphate-dependent acetolactate synthase large subunit-like protein
MSPDHEVLQAAAEMLASAQRPVLLAGRGAVSQDAREAPIELGELLGVD